MSRLSHHIVSLGTLQIQLLVIYGFPATYTDANHLNCQLLQSALEAAECLSLPTIIAGDFNCNPFDLSIAADLHLRGYQDLQSLHRKIYGTAMPCTCRQATTPDNALISPELTSCVSQIQVHQEPLFDTHCPVIFELSIHHEQQFRSQMDMPRSWIPLGFDDSYWIRAYADAKALHGSPKDLGEWGVVVEHAADQVHRKTQSQHHDVPYTSTQGLPSSYRGRCQPRKVRKCPIRSLTKVGRPGDFQPQHEVQTFATMKLITQLRRIRSLKRQLCKLQVFPVNNARERALLQEWKAILSHPNFVPWCCNTPEVGPPPVSLPTVDFLHDIDQLMTYEVDQRVHAEASLAKNKQAYARQLDRRFHGSSSAFSALRDAPSNYIETLSVDIEENGILASDPSDDTLEIFVDRSKEFSKIDFVHVNSLPCRISHIQEHSLVVTRHPELSLDTEEVSLRQTQIVVDKPRIFDLLTSFWLPFWQTTSTVTAQDENSFETFLDLFATRLAGYIN